MLIISPLSNIIFISFCCHSLSFLKIMKYYRASVFLQVCWVSWYNSFCQTATTSIHHLKMRSVESVESQQHTNGKVSWVCRGCHCHAWKESKDWQIKRDGKQYFSRRVSPFCSHISLSHTHICSLSLSRRPWPREVTTISISAHSKPSLSFCLL